MTSTSPHLADLENRAVDRNHGPKRHFPFSANALPSLRSQDQGTAGDVSSAEALGGAGKMCLPVISLCALKQSSKDEVTTVELGWDTGVPKLLLL